MPGRLDLPGISLRAVGFIKSQFRVESQSVPGVPIFFHGRIAVDGGSRLIRSASAATRLSAIDPELFRRQAA